MVVTLFGGLKTLCKMLPVGELYSKFVLEQTNSFLNPSGNNTAIICDGQ